MTDYTQHPEYQALVAVCRANPFDTALRLILADWVQEHGEDEEHAAFLRQCNIFAWPAPLVSMKEAAESFRRFGEVVAQMNARIIDGLAPTFAAAADAIAKATPEGNR